MHPATQLRKSEHIAQHQSVSPKQVQGHLSNAWVFVASRQCMCDRDTDEAGIQSCHQQSYSFARQLRKTVQLAIQVCSSGLLQALEREAADEEFGKLFGNGPSMVSR